MIFDESDNYPPENILFSLFPGHQNLLIFFLYSGYLFLVFFSGFFFLFLITIPVANGSSWAKNQICASTATGAAAIRFLTHWTTVGTPGFLFLSPIPEVSPGSSPHIFSRHRYTHSLGDFTQTKTLNTVYMAMGFYVNISPAVPGSHCGYSVPYPRGSKLELWTTTAGVLVRLLGTLPLGPKAELWPAITRLCYWNSVTTPRVLSCSYDPTSLGLICYSSATAPCPGPLGPESWLWVGVTEAKLMPLIQLSPGCKIRWCTLLYSASRSKPLSHPCHPRYPAAGLAFTQESESLVTQKPRPQFHGRAPYTCTSETTATTSVSMEGLRCWGSSLCTRPRTQTPWMYWVPAH